MLSLRSIGEVNNVVSVGFTAKNAGVDEVTGLDSAIKNGALDSALSNAGVSGVSATEVVGQVVQAGANPSSNVGGDGAAGQETGATGGAASAPAAGSGLSMGMVAAVIGVGALLVVLVAAVAFVVIRSRNGSKTRVMSMNQSHSVLPNPHASPSPRKPKATRNGW